MDLDTILPHCGLDVITFGCDIAKVESTLGAPSQTVADDDGDVTLVYQDLELTFRFWLNYRLRLGAITSERTRMRFGEVEVGGSAESTIAWLVTDVMHATVSERDGCIHEDGTRQTWLEVKDLCTTFWFLENRLYLADWGVRWKDDEEPEWPKGSAA
jgi:hypothetical protein